MRLILVLFALLFALLSVVALLSVGCATSALRQYDPKTGDLVLKVNTINVLTGRGDVTLTKSEGTIVYGAGVSSEGISDNGLEVVKEIPAIATAIGKASTGTSAFDPDAIDSLRRLRETDGP